MLHSPYGVSAPRRSYGYDSSSFLLCSGKGPKGQDSYHASRAGPHPSASATCKSRESVKLTFLGTGTSFGVPIIGCHCPTCTSTDARDRRTRSGALLTLPHGTLLVDTPPELRLQLLREQVGRIDAVWYTHLHADHVHGIDDLRIFSDRVGAPIQCYVPRGDGPAFQEKFNYIFDDGVRVPYGTSKPQLQLVEVGPTSPRSILGAEVQPVPVPHGSMEVFGFRVGRLGYITDAKSLPDEAVDRLRGVEVLVLNALWYGNPHPTHFTVEEAVDAAGRVGADRTLLVHLTHRVRHQELLDRLPAGIEPAYDGLSLEIADG